MFRKGLAASLGASIAMLSLTSVDAAPLEPDQYGDFDRYVLALSWQNGFCQSLHDRGGPMPDECRLQKEIPQKVDFLTVHGLWPSLPKSIAARGVDDKRWMRYGCATRPIPNMAEAKISQKCSAAETGLSLEMANQLNTVMPGAGGTSCLERYEYAKHGICFGFDPDALFGTMVRMDEEVKRSAPGLFLANNYGKHVSRSDFDAAVASAWGDNAVKAIKLNCSGNPAYLTEMQITLDARAINEPISAKSLLPQPHPGSCGNDFIIDPVGY